jgi:hypothetical protein
MPVEELHALSDRPGLGELREAPFEGTQVYFQSPGILLKTISCQALLGSEEFRDGDLTAQKVFRVDKDIAPLRDTTPDSQIERWAVDDSFLSGPDQRPHSRIAQDRTTLRLAETLELVRQVRPSEEAFSERPVASKEEIGFLAVTG